MLSQEWECISHNTMLELVQMNRLCVSEYTLFETLENWGWCQSLDEYNGDLSALLLPLLQHVRFRTMKSADFCRVCSNTLNAEQQLSILRCLALNDPDSLPPGFNKTLELRCADGSEK